MKQGLKENLVQFILLVFVNALVGCLIGIERSIIPEFAAYQFKLSNTVFLLSFIAVFGLAKALTNYFAGKFANRFGRKNLLLVGWLFAIPIPFLFIYATNWNSILLANSLLGINQGLTWSSTIVMKIDLVGEKNRGFAMGLNEFSGYFAIGLMALITSWIAENFGVTPYPFYLSFFIICLGFILSWFTVDTHLHAQQEKKQKNQEVTHIFKETTYRHKILSTITQAGFVNNLNDGMLWGLLPLLLIKEQISTEKIGWFIAIYPFFWAFTQLFSGKLGDHFNVKTILFWGMLLQAIAILCLGLIHINSILLILLSILLGIGTGLVYPNFFTALAQNTNSQQRAEIIGVFRLWRDLGYVFGAITAGILANLFSIQVAIVFVGGLTLISTLIIPIRYKN